MPYILVKKMFLWSFYIGEPNFSPGCGIRMLVFFIKNYSLKIGISKIEAKIILRIAKSKKYIKNLVLLYNSKNDNFEKYNITKDIFKKRYYSNI